MAELGLAGVAIIIGSTLVREGNRSDCGIRAKGGSFPWKAAKKQSPPHAGSRFVNAAPGGEMIGL